MSGLEAEPAGRAAPSFTGASILDLEAERAQLEHAMERLDDPDAVARMRARLEVVRTEIADLGLAGY